MNDANVGFFTFLSRTLGTGSPSLDTIILLGIGVALTLLFQTMQKAGQGVEISSREVELLNSISSLLSTMNIQLIEMRSSIFHEFDRFNAELTFFKQELLDLQKVADEYAREKSQAEYIAKPVIEDLHGLFAAVSSHEDDI